MSNGGEGGASVNNNAPAQNPWQVLNAVPFGGGALNGEIQKTRDMNRAEAASNKADNKFQSANTAASEAESYMKEAREDLMAASDDVKSLEKDSAAKEAVVDEIQTRLDSAEADFNQLKSESGRFDYIKIQAGAAAEILKKGGAVLKSALKNFTAKMMAKMPRIVIQSPIKFTNAEKLAGKTKADYREAADAQYEADRKKREKAEEKVDKANDKAKEFEKSKSSFQDAIEAFRKNKENRAKSLGKLDAAKEEVDKVKSELGEAQSELNDINEELGYAKEDLKDAEAEYKDAEKEYNSAKEKANAAKKVADEKALRFDRLKTLAQFKEKLGDMPISQWRHDISFRRDSIAETLELFEGSMSEEQVEKAKARIQLLGDQLKALDVYEEQLAQKKATPATKEGVVEEVKAESETADEMQNTYRTTAETQTEEKTTDEMQSPSRRWFNNLNDDDEEERRKKATAAA